MRKRKPVDHISHSPFRPTTVAAIILPQSAPIEREKMTSTLDHMDGSNHRLCLATDERNYPPYNKRTWLLANLNFDIILRSFETAHLA